jgi:hypothetical protein
VALEPWTTRGPYLAVSRARARAERTGELEPIPSGALALSIEDDLADFLQCIVTDGTYVDEVARIGEADPDVATI